MPIAVKGRDGARAGHQSGTADESGRGVGRADGDTPGRPRGLDLLLGSRTTLPASRPAQRSPPHLRRSGTATHSSRLTVCLRRFFGRSPRKAHRVWISSPFSGAIYGADHQLTHFRTRHPRSRRTDDRLRPGQTGKVLVLDRAEGSVRSAELTSAPSVGRRFGQKLMGGQPDHSLHLAAVLPQLDSAVSGCLLRLDRSAI